MEHAVVTRWTVDTNGNGGVFAYTYDERGNRRTMREQSDYSGTTEQQESVAHKLAVKVFGDSAQAISRRMPLTATKTGWWAQSVIVFSVND